MNPSEAPMPSAATVIPSQTRSACEVSSSLSLNVPGSPSSALQTTTRGCAAMLLQLSHLTPVVKPAPPRPSRLARLISSSTGCATWPLASARANAARSASPGCNEVGQQRSALAHRRCTVNSSAGHSSSGRRARIRPHSVSIRSASSRGTGRPFTSSDGPWSGSPRNDAWPTLTRPSCVTLPGSAQSRWHIRCMSSALPCMRSVTSSENSTR